MIESVSSSCGVRFPKTEAPILRWRGNSSAIWYQPDGAFHKTIASEIQFACNAYCLSKIRGCQIKEQEQRFWSISFIYAVTIIFFTGFLVDFKLLKFDYWLCCLYDIKHLFVFQMVERVGQGEISSIAEWLASRKKSHPIMYITLIHFYGSPILPL